MFLLPVEAVKTRYSKEEGTENHYVYRRLEGGCESAFK